MTRIALWLLCAAACQQPESTHIGWRASHVVTYGDCLPPCCATSFELGTATVFPASCWDDDGGVR